MCQCVYFEVHPKGLSRAPTGELSLAGRRRAESSRNLHTLMVLLLRALCAAAVLLRAACLLPHPRLLLPPSRLAEIVAAIGRGGAAALTAASLRAKGVAYLSSPLTPYTNCTVVGACRNAAVFGAGASYIDAGTVSGLLTTLALLHRLDNNASAPGAEQPTAWSARAAAELAHVCSPAWPHWYWPVGQALERAGIAYGVGVAYDWLYAVLPADARSAVEAAVASRVLDTRLRDAREGMWWTDDVGNWNVNANLPILAAALAVVDVPALAAAAGAVVAEVLASASTSMAMWAPDGVWPEGPTYGAYTMTSFAQGCGALATAGYAPAPAGAGACAWTPGACAWGRSALLLTGATSNTHNWGDAHAEQVRSAPLFAASAACAAPELAAAARILRAGGGGAVEDLLWWSDAGNVSQLAALPLAAVFADPSPDAARGRKTHVGALRSAWSWGDGGAVPPNASAAVSVQFKGGQNHFDDHGSDSHNNHGHLDVGSFVLDAQGVRFAVDLGPDAYDYPLLAYFGRFRFGYHFLSSVAHNVLSFDSDTQHRRGSGGIVAADVRPGAATPFATLDVTSAYGGAARVQRTFALLGGAGVDAACVPVVVADVWQHGTAANAVWTLHTTAAVDLSSGAPLLTATAAGAAGSAQQPARLRLTAAAPAPVTWAVTTLALPPPQATTYNGAAVFIVTATVPATAGELNVTMTPCA